MEITFLGAAGTVTGSKYLVNSGSKFILVDCGLFQGFKELRLRNWAPLPVNPKLIDAVILTHAHIDHSGYIPLLVKNGYPGRIYCTSATHGTSGMKAAFEWCSQPECSGWWIEGHIEGVTGWSIGENSSKTNASSNNHKKDAELLYDKLEQKVVPLFYSDRDRFIDVMRHATALNGSFFNTHRMLQQYVLNAYFR